MSSFNYGCKFIATIGLTLALAATSLHAAQGSAHEHEHGVTPVNQTLNNGKKWATDEALRHGMWNIRAEIEAALPEIHEGKFSNAKYDELAGRISSELSSVVANCKLEPKADAQLHLIIADLVGGVEMMEGKTKKVKRQAGAIKVLDALVKYAAYFDHPDWKPMTH